MSLKIGIDGGGSKTELILVDGAGAILARHVGPGCNPSHLGPEKARAILLEALQQLLARSSRLVTPGEVVATQLYMAGAPAFWRETAVGLAGFGRVTTDLDSLPVLELATGGRPGLVMHAGTGSFIAARAPDGRLHYAGGVGWMFGDPGSGHDLGRRAIARGLRELQGWSRRTALADDLCTYAGINEYAAISRYFYTTDDANARIAGFAPQVIALAKAGNAPAQLSLAESLTELVALGRLVTARLFDGSPVTCGVSGAILNHEVTASTLRTVAANPAWPVNLHFITDSPIEGVRRLLLRS